MTVMVCCHLCLSDYVEHDQQRAVVNAKNVASLFSRWPPGSSQVFAFSARSVVLLSNRSQSTITIIITIIAIIIIIIIIIFSIHIIIPMAL